jgi:hypothetical protein
MPTTPERDWAMMKLPMNRKMVSSVKRPKTTSTELSPSGSPR